MDGTPTASPPDRQPSSPILPTRNDFCHRRSSAGRGPWCWERSEQYLSPSAIIADHPPMPAQTLPYYPFWLRATPYPSIAIPISILATRNGYCHRRPSVGRGKGRTHTLFSLRPMSSSCLYWLRALFRRDCGEKADCTTRLS